MLMENISNIYIDDKKKISLAYVLLWMKIWWAFKKLLHYILYNINIDWNIMDSLRTFIYLIGAGIVEFKM
jgi:hypothetical protein